MAVRVYVPIIHITVGRLYGDYAHYLKQCMYVQATVQSKV